MEIRTLLTRFAADTSDFKSGSEQVKTKLTELNKEFFKNSYEIKKVEKDIRALQKEQQEYEKNLKSGKELTAEQTKKYEENRQKIDELILKKAKLKTEESDLRTKISANTNEMKKQTQHAEEMSNKLKYVGNVLKSLALGYMGKKLYEYLISSNAQMEQYITSFSVMLGDAEKAKKLMSDLTDFAAKTPLQLEDTVTAAQKLMNYGVGDSEIINKLTQLGDLAAGDAVKLDRVSLAYGQMLAKGKVTGEELRQMTEAGVPLLQALADSMGKTTAEVQSMISKSKVGISELDTAIESLTSGDGKFAGMMEQQSHTLSGMLSTLEDDLKQFGRDIGAEGFELVKDELEDVMTTIERAKENGTIEEAAEDLGNLVKIVINFLTLIWKFRDGVFAGVSAMVAWKATFAITNTLTQITGALKTFTTAQKAAQIATEGLTVAQTAANVAAAANPYVLLASALAAVVAGAAGFVAMSDSTGKSAKDNLADVKSELESVNSELQTTKDRIKELEGKDKLTFTEAEELTRLKDENDELERKNALLREQEKIAQANNAKETRRNFEKEFGGEFNPINDEFELSNKLSELRKEYDELKEDYAARHLIMTEIELNEITDQINRIGVEIQKAESKQSEFQSSENSVNFETYVNQMIERYSKLKGKIAAGISLTSDEQTVYDTYYKQLVDYGIRLKEYVEDYGVEDEVSKKWETMSNRIVSALDIVDEKQAELSSDDKFQQYIENLSESTEDLKTAMQSLESEYDVLTAAQKEFNECGTLTSSTLVSIIEKYPEMEGYVDRYIAGLISEKELLAELSKAYERDSENFRQSVIAKLKNDEEFYMQLLADNKEFVELMSANYNIDLENYKTYNEAKYKVATQMLGAVAKNWETFYNIESNTMTNAMNSYARTHPEEAQAFINAVSQYRDFSSMLDENINFDSVTIPISSGSSSSSGGTSTGSSASKENDTFKLANEAFKKLVNDRIDEIKRLTDAETKAADERIAAIDAEIEARKRLTEDTDLQKQIDAVKAQLEYAQLDSFSRMELEKELKKLEKEQEDILWQRAKADEKEAIKAELEDKKAYYAQLQEQIKESEQYANRLFSDLASGTTSNQTIVNNNSRAANVTIVNNALTMAQIEQKIRDMLGVTLT